MLHQLRRIQKIEVLRSGTEAYLSCARRRPYDHARLGGRMRSIALHLLDLGMARTSWTQFQLLLQVFQQAHRARDVFRLTMEIGRSTLLQQR